MTDRLSASVPCQSFSESQMEIIREVMKAEIADLLLHIKLLTARINDLRAEMRTEGTRRALLKGLDKRAR